jgi:uncharacterized protein (DUF2336 family)
MSASLGILHDIRTAISAATDADRGALLRHVTDLFIVGVADYSEDELVMFDEVFMRLVAEIEASSRALLALRLAPLRRAPPTIIRTLAFDDEVDVAGPVLTQSERLDDPALVENAGTMSQGHLLAISRRQSLSTAVTDVLIDRGDSQVVLSIARNAGAAFSEAGFTRLVERARCNDMLTASVAVRTDIPWHHFASLVAKASGHVREKLNQDFPHARWSIKEVVDEASARVADAYAAASGMTDVETSLAAMHRAGQLDDEQIRVFAEDGLSEHVSASLCILGDLPPSFIEKALSECTGESLLVLARATGLSWATARTIMQMPVGRRRPPVSTELTKRLARYVKLSQATAQQIMRFYRTQLHEERRDACGVRRSSLLSER